MKEDDWNHLETEGGKNRNKNLLLLQVTHELEGKTTKSSLALIHTFREVSLMTALLCHRSGVHLSVWFNPNLSGWTFKEDEG